MIFLFLLIALLSMAVGIYAWFYLDPRRYKAEPVGFDPEVERLLEMEDFFLS